MMNHKILTIFLLLVANSSFAQQNEKYSPKLKQKIPVAQVWSGHPVDFDILTTEKFQYVVFYDTARVMTVAQRQLNKNKWKFHKFSSTTGWDSHNYIAITRDKNGYLHISGNMHNVPLIYYRSTKPDDISEFEQPAMIGKDENSVTYPVFFKDSEGELYFQHRNGGSGRGVTFWNKYDAVTGKWTRVFDQGLFDGEGETNAYPFGPVLGPDGYFHMVWMWRANPTANTNHNLSHIKSKNLIDWENIKGEHVEIPVKWRDASVFVDPVGPWNGLINMNFHISWDNQKRLCLDYHKYDRNGISQSYIARWEGDHWNINKVSEWENYTWPLNLGGSLSGEVNISELKPIGNNEVLTNYHHQKFGDGVWVLDENKLTIKDRIPGANYLLPTALASNPPENEGMEINRVLGNNGKYLLQWETLPRNRDLPRNPPYPKPTQLVVVELE